MIRNRKTPFSEALTTMLTIAVIISCMYLYSVVGPTTNSRLSLTQFVTQLSNANTYKLPAALFINILLLIGATVVNFIFTFSVYNMLMTFIDFVDKRTNIAFNKLTDRLGTKTWKLTMAMLSIPFVIIPLVFSGYQLLTSNSYDPITTLFSVSVISVIIRKVYTLK